MKGAVTTARQDCLHPAQPTKRLLCLEYEQPVIGMPWHYTLSDASGKTAHISTYLVPQSYGEYDVAYHCEEADQYASGWCIHQTLIARYEEDSGIYNAKVANEIDPAFADLVEFLAG